MIEIKDVTKVYGIDGQQLCALDNVSLKIKKGEFIIILGQSGCGKSTLLNILGGMDRPTYGEVTIEGENLAKKKPDQLARYRREQVGMIFQKFNLIGDMSLLENVMMPLKFSGYDSRKQKRIALKALEEVGLLKRAKSLPGKLSGGQQQRVAVARSLVNNPAILLCDEPTGNLDSKTGKEIMDMIASLNHKGHTIVMVTHNEQYASYANRVIKMLDGKIVDRVVINKTLPKSEFIPTKSKTIKFLSRIKLALKNLKRRKLRFFLTAFGVSIGAMAIVVLVSFGAGLQRDVDRQIKDFNQVEEITVSGEKTSGLNFSMGADFEKKDVKPLNDTTINELSAIDNVQTVYPNVYDSGEIKYGDKVAVFYSANSKPVNVVKDETKQKIAYGSYFESDSENSVILPYGQAVALGFNNPADAVGKDVILRLKSNQKEYTLTIKGVYSQDEKMAYNTLIPNLRAQEIWRDVKADDVKKIDGYVYTELVVRVNDVSRVSDVKSAIDAKGFGTYSYEDVAKQISRIFIVMQVVLGIVGGIALLVASLGIANTMLMSVLERTKEIGIMKAIGARGRDISSVFLSEAFLIGLFGGLFGLLLGYGGAHICETVMNNYITANDMSSETLSFYVPYYLSIGVVIFSVLVSSLAGYFPAKRAAKLDPVNALRDE